MGTLYVENAKMEWDYNLLSSGKVAWRNLLSTFMGNSIFNAIDIFQLFIQRFLLRVALEFEVGYCIFEGLELSGIFKLDKVLIIHSRIFLYNIY